MKSEAFPGPSRCGMVLCTMESHRGVFEDLEEFVADHRTCGTLTGGVGDPSADGYLLWVACSCGVAFERWVTPAAATDDLLRSGLLALPN
ncbi:MAG: hypothetical protein ACRD1X_09450 [Vicinamibacteria bacterium]